MVWMLLVNEMDVPELELSKDGNIVVKKTSLEKVLEYCTEFYHFADKAFREAANMASDAYSVTEQPGYWEVLAVCTLADIYILTKTAEYLKEFMN